MIIKIGKLKTMLEPCLFILTRLVNKDNGAMEFQHNDFNFIVEVKENNLFLYLGEVMNEDHCIRKETFTEKEEYNLQYICWILQRINAIVGY